MLILAHAPTLVDLAVVAAILLIGPLIMTLVLWWALDPPGWLASRQGEARTPPAAVVVAWLLNAATTAVWAYLGASGRDVLVFAGAIGTVISTLLPGSIVALVTILAGGALRRRART